MASEVLGTNSRWVFAPTRPYLRFRSSTAAFSRLGCWGASYTPTLDTLISIPHLVKSGPRNCSSRGPSRRYYWKAKERRESGEDKRDFEELLRRDWLQFERRRKRWTWRSSIGREPASLLGRRSQRRHPINPTAGCCAAPILGL